MTGIFAKRVHFVFAPVRGATDLTSSDGTLIRPANPPLTNTSFNKMRRCMAIADYTQYVQQLNLLEHIHWSG